MIRTWMKGSAAMAIMGLAVPPVMGLVVTPVLAQEPGGERTLAEGRQGIEGRIRPGPNGPGALSALELALENREELELTGHQVTRLQELVEIKDRDVAPVAEDLARLREGIRSGDVPRDEGMREMLALRGRLMTASAPLQGRVREILTVAQHDELQRLRARTRPGVDRRALGGGLRSPGVMRGRGAGRPGMGGPGLSARGWGRGVVGPGPRGLGRSGSGIRGGGLPGRGVLGPRSGRRPGAPLVGNRRQGAPDRPLLRRWWRGPGAGPVLPPLDER